MNRFEQIGRQVEEKVVWPMVKWMKKTENLKKVGRGLSFITFFSHYRINLSNDI